MTHLSRKWFLGAAHATTPVGWRKLIDCSSDCDSCPLAVNGCAKNCTRWDTLICFDCPCLGHPCCLDDPKMCVDPTAADIVDMPCKDPLKR